MGSLCCRDISHLRGSAYGQACGQDEQTGKRAVGTAKAAEIGHGFEAEPLRHQRMRRNIFELKQRWRTKPLVFAQQEFAFTAQIRLESGIKNEAPENVPVARLAVYRVLIDDQIVVVFGFARSAILRAGDDNVKVEAFVGRLIVTQTLAKVPRADAGHAARADRFRREDQIVTIVIDRERLHRFAHGSGSSKTGRGNRND